MKKLLVLFLLFSTSLTRTTDLPKGTYPLALDNELYRELCGLIKRNLVITGKIKPHMTVHCEQPVTFKWYTIEDKPLTEPQKKTCPEAYTRAVLTLLSLGYISLSSGRSALSLYRQLIQQDELEQKNQDTCTTTDTKEEQIMKLKAIAKEKTELTKRIFRQAFISASAGLGSFILIIAALS